MESPNWCRLEKLWSIWSDRSILSTTYHTAAVVELYTDILEWHNTNIIYADVLFDQCTQYFGKHNCKQPARNTQVIITLAKVHEVRSTGLKTAKLVLLPIGDLPTNLSRSRSRSRLLWNRWLSSMWVKYCVLWSWTILLINSYRRCAVILSRGHVRMNQHKGLWLDRQFLLYLNAVLIIRVIFDSTCGALCCTANCS